MLNNKGNQLYIVLIHLLQVLLLYEHTQYREAASFINRLSVGTFRIILRELPLELFVEAMPHSMPILEALYAKVSGTNLLTCVIMCLNGSIFLHP